MQTLLTSTAPSPAGAHDCYLSAPKVRERYGSIGEMTLHRWVRDEGMGFPQPIYFGRLRFWLLRDLVAWERARACKARATA